MTKSTKSIKSPLHASRDNSRGGPPERMKRYKARDSVESRSWTQREGWGRMGKLTVYKVKLASLDVGRDRETVAGGERRRTDCESQLPVPGPCVALDNVTVTGLDRESENNHLLSQNGIRTCCRSRLRGRTNGNNVNCLAGIHSAEARAIAREVCRAKLSEVVTDETNIETTFRSPDVFSPHFLKEARTFFPPKRKFPSFSIGTAVLLKFHSFSIYGIYFLKFHSFSRIP